MIERGIAHQGPADGLVFPLTGFPIDEHGMPPQTMQIGRSSDTLACYTRYGIDGRGRWTYRYTPTTTEGTP